MFPLFVVLCASAPMAALLSDSSPMNPPPGSSPAISPAATLSSPAIAGLTTLCVAATVGAVFLVHHFYAKRGRPAYVGLSDQNLTTGQLMG
jgi:hypothetical protein